MAELNVFANKLQKELTCSICDEIFTNPRTLKCLHSFCLECISKWNRSCRRQNQTLSCPSCRSIERLEGNDVSSLPSSFHLQPQLQLLHDVRIAVDTKAQQELSDCVCCKKQSKLVAFCPRYQGLICTACVTAHQTSTPEDDKQHPMMFRCDLMKQDANSYIRNCLFCQERYCLTCKECICSVCNAERHKPHHTVTVNEVAEEVKVFIKRDMDRVNKVKEKFEEELRFSKQNIARIEQEINAAIKQVSDEVQKHIKVLREGKAAVIETLKRKLQQQKTLNGEEQTQIREVIESISEFYLQGQTLLDENVAHFIVKSQQDRSQRCEAFLGKTLILSTRPIQRYASVCFITNDQVTQCLKNIGKVVESVTDPSCCFIEIESLDDIACGFVNSFNVVTPQNEPCVTGFDLIDVQIHDGDGLNVEKEMCQSETGRYTVKYRAEKPCDYTIHVRINGQEIQNSPQTLKARDIRREFKPVKTFGGKGCVDGQLLLRLPRSLAVSDREEVAVIADMSKHRIVIFSVDGEFLRHFGEEGTREGQLSNPFGIVFNEDRLLVTDNSNGTGRLQEFSLNGTYCRTIYKERGVELQGMCITDDNIAVCFKNQIGQNQSGVKLLNKQSGQLMHHIHCVDRDETIHCIAYGNGKYFVSYPGKDYISVYDSNGLFLYKFGEKGNGDGQFDRPRGLAVINSAILVCDDNDRVQMLNQDGQFVRSFGKNGSGLGEMNGPSDIAVAPDGKVFVLEWGNQRVHVWQS